MAVRQIPTILVVEDSADYARGLQIFLQEEGFETSWAPDADSARSSIERQRPDLIILDISLPDENGIEFCRSLRRSRLAGDVPIIILSAHLEMATFLAETNQGADLYLEKSIHYEELLIQVETLLRARRR